MAFDFENLRDSVLAAGRTAGDKINEASAQARLRLDIRAKEINLNELYAELGKAVYEAAQSEETAGDFAELIAGISEAKAELDALKAEVTPAPSANEVTCPVCGLKQSKDHLFCSKCGAPIQ